MSAPGKETAATALFDLYEKPNIVEEGHRRALGYQALLRELRPYLDSDELERVINEAITELDQVTGHVGMKIVVTGMINVRSLDPQGISLSTQEVDESTIHEASSYVEDTLFESMGYIIEPKNDDIYISHLAKGGDVTIIDDTKYGEVRINNRIYIPIDGTAFVHPYETPEQSPQEILEHFAGELLQDIDIAILNSEDTTDALRRLGAIDLSDYKRVYGDDSLARALNKYIMATLEIGGVTLYQMSGVTNVRVKLEDDEHSNAHLNPNLPLTGHVEGIVIDGETSRFSLHTTLPFSDEVEREVTFPLEPTIVVNHHPILIIR